MVGGKYMLKNSNKRLQTLLILLRQKQKLKLLAFVPGEKLHEQMISSEDSDYTMNTRVIIKFYHKLIIGQKIQKE